jgi:hypothetical protein
MTRATPAFTLLLTAAAALVIHAQTPAFDLNAWNKVGDANWRVVENGTVVEATEGKGGFLVTPRDYGDFEMTVDVWVTPASNSGVFVRASNPKEITATNSYEINIWDERPDPKYRTGAIVNVAEPLTKVDAGNKWNTLTITARGGSLSVTLNGVPTVKGAQDTKFARGPIALQYGSGTVRFRNVRIRAL